MKTREKILSEGMLRDPHPVYGLLTYARWQRAMDLLERVGDGMTGHEMRAAQWVVCTRNASAPELDEVMVAEAPRSALRELWENSLHVSDIQEFAAWWDSEMEAANAAQTVHKPDSRLGKPAAPEEPTPAT